MASYFRSTKSLRVGNGIEPSQGVSGGFFQSTLHITSQTPCIVDNQVNIEASIPPLNQQLLGGLNGSRQKSDNITKHEDDDPSHANLALGNMFFLDNHSAVSSWVGSYITVGLQVIHPLHPFAGWSSAPEWVR